MRILRFVISAALLVVSFVATDFVGASGLPPTLTHVAKAGVNVVDPAFPIDYIGVQWDGPRGHASVRFRYAGHWTRWAEVKEEGIQRPGHFTSALVWAGDADAYQVRVPGGVRNASVTSINTTDGQRKGGVAKAAAATPVVSRPVWGADPSLMTWAPEYQATQKLTVHHTATRNDDTDPAATVRAIYRWHAVDNKWGDIGYQFLIDEAGVVYEGRYSGDDGDPGHDASGRSVTASHVGGWNSGNVGVALLGTLTDRGPSAAAQASLESVLADLAGRHGLDPTGSSTYVNPVNGARWTGPNVAGHRDFVATECPGGALYALLPAIRQNVKNRLAPTSPPTQPADTTAPVIGGVTTSRTSTSITVSWTTDDQATTQVDYRKRRSTAWLTGPSDPSLTTSHRGVLSGLTRSTDYEVRITSTNARGLSSSVVRNVSTTR